MSSTRRILTTIAVGIAVGAGPAVASPAMADHNTHRSLSALLTGSQVVIPPGTADPDAWGAASVRVWPRRGLLCYTLFVSNLGTPSGADIQRGRRGVDGPSVVGLDEPAPRFSRGCEVIGQTLASRMVNNPRRFYMEVDSSTGSIRGQLH